MAHNPTYPGLDEHHGVGLHTYTQRNMSAHTGTPTFAKYVLFVLFTGGLGVLVTPWFFKHHKSL